MVKADDCRIVDATLRAEGIYPLWLFTRRTATSAPPLANMESFANGENEESERAVIQKVAQHLRGIARRFGNANALLAVLKERGWSHDVVCDLGIPTAVMATDPASSECIRIDIRNRIDLDIVRGGARQDYQAEIQRDLANALQARITDGIELWWPGYPELAINTFERLKQEYRFRKEEARRIEGLANQRVEQMHRVASTARPARLILMPDRKLHELAENDAASPPQSMAGWGKVRADHIRNAAAKVMAADAVDCWMDTPNPKLGGKTPNQVAVRESQALERCEIALGLRDPATRRPIDPQRTIIESN